MLELWLHLSKVLGWLVEGELSDRFETILLENSVVSGVDTSVSPADRLAQERAEWQAWRQSSLKAMSGAEIGIRLGDAYLSGHRLPVVDYVRLDFPPFDPFASRDLRGSR